MDKKGRGRGSRKRLSGASRMKEEEKEAAAGGESERGGGVSCWKKRVRGESPEPNRAPLELELKQL